jgi:peptidoglycan/xylan/chitin deacetylase (PgdA/CDA1 family)
MNPKLNAYLQQINFLIGRNPKLEKRSDWRKFIPEPYKAVVLISADFELAWAGRYSKSSPDPLQKSLSKARLERENMPVLLSLCERFNIPITWLTVGHLFLDSCLKVDGSPHPEIPRLPHFENNWWRYVGDDWFEHDPCTNYHVDPLWYCPDLIEQILNSKVKHEIGCHTFSHIDCRNDVCKPELFSAELEACAQAAKRFGIDKMVSFVHPGHMIGNLKTLAEMGYTNFRTDYDNILGYPKKHTTGMWVFNTTLEFDYFPLWSISSQIKRYIKLFERAKKNNSVAYIWFHPSFNRLFAECVLPVVFKWLDDNRNDIWLVNKAEYVNFLNENI